VQGEVVAGLFLRQARSLLEERERLVQPPLHLAHVPETVQACDAVACVSRRLARVLEARERLVQLAPLDVDPRDHAVRRRGALRTLLEEALEARERRLEVAFRPEHLAEVGDVGRLQVAVHDAPGVRVANGVADLQERLEQRDAAALVRPLRGWRACERIPAGFGRLRLRLASLGLLAVSSIDTGRRRRSPARARDAETRAHLQRVRGYLLETLTALADDRSATTASDWSRWLKKNAKRGFRSGS